jgi:integrase
MPGGPSARRVAIVGHRLACFCADQGLGGGLAPGPELLEAFCRLGLAGRASSTKGTYRSVLRSLGGPGRPVPATPFSGSAAKAPYSAQERAELLSVAASQRSGQRRSSALAFLALGIGAGLRAGELAAVIGDDISARRGGVSVQVGAGRAVPVSGPYAKILTQQAKAAGPSYLFCPGGADRSYHNFVNNFCYGLVADPAAPRLSSGRARASFICDHLVARTPLPALLYMSGIYEVESLLRYARHVPGAPGSKAELRERLRQP